MEHLHVRLPKELKFALKRYCRDNNIAVTSALIIMITNELRNRSFAIGDAANNPGDTPSLGFVLRQ